MQEVLVCNCYTDCFRAKGSWRLFFTVWEGSSFCSARWQGSPNKSGLAAIIATFFKLFFFYPTPAKHWNENLSKPSPLGGRWLMKEGASPSVHIPWPVGSRSQTRAGQAHLVGSPGKVWGSHQRARRPEWELESSLSDPDDPWLLCRSGGCFQCKRGTWELLWCKEGGGGWLLILMMLSLSDLPAGTSYFSRSHTHTRAQFHRTILFK